MLRVIRCFYNVCVRACVCVCRTQYLLMLLNKSPWSSFCYFFSNNVSIALLFFPFSLIINGRKRKGKEKEGRKGEKDNKRTWKRGGYDFKFGPTFSFRCDINVRWRFVIFTRGTRFLTKATYYRIALLCIRLRYKIFINYISLINYD